MLSKDETTPGSREGERDASAGNASRCCRNSDSDTPAIKKPQKRYLDFRELGAHEVWIYYKLRATLANDFANVVIRNLSFSLAMGTLNFH